MKRRQLSAKRVAAFERASDAPTLSRGASEPLPALATINSLVMMPIGRLAGWLAACGASAAATEVNLHSREREKALFLQLVGWRAHGGAKTRVLPIGAPPPPPPRPIARSRLRRGRERAKKQTTPSIIHHAARAAVCRQWPRAREQETWKASRRASEKANLRASKQADSQAGRRLGHRLMRRSLARPPAVHLFACGAPFFVSQAGRICGRRARVHSCRLDPRGRRRANYEARAKAARHRPTHWRAHKLDEGRNAWRD